MVRLAGAGTDVFGATTGRDCFRTLAHRAFCASAIFLREAADITRFGWIGSRDTANPFNDSIPEMICLASQPLSALGSASREALAAHSLNLTLLPLREFYSRLNCIGWNAGRISALDGRRFDEVEEVRFSRQGAFR
jgi:hypothetical protein